MPLDSWFTLQRFEETEVKTIRCGRIRRGTIHSHFGYKERRASETGNGVRTLFNLI